jgi:hypothetical protein
MAAGVACWSSVQFATPIDRALPFFGVIVAVLGWAAGRPSIATAVAVLIACEMLFSDEPTRLLAIGIVMAAAFAFSVLERGAGVSPARGVSSGRDARSPLVITTCAILVLRWIPFENVVLWRELIVLAGALLIVAVMPRSPLAIAIAVTTGLFTPAWPSKTLALPFVVAALVAVLARRLKPEGGGVAAALQVALMVTFFPWSGLVARGRFAFTDPPRVGDRAEIRYSLKPGESVAISIPDDAVALIISAANVPRLRRGTPLGRIESIGMRLNIGDASDWGFMRREHFFASRNGFPHNPAGRIRDFGWATWIDGAGRVLLPRGVKAITITADPKLPAEARLQVEAIEKVPR